MKPETTVDIVPPDVQPASPDGTVVESVEGKTTTQACPNCTKTIYQRELCECTKGPGNSIFKATQHGGKASNHVG